MNKLKQVLRSLKWYITLFVVGGAIATIAILTEALTTERSFLIAPITITAFVASLIVANAAFAKSESKHKWVVQYAVMPMFGVYTIILLYERNFVELFLLICAAATHMGYWMSSVHSRDYLLKEFRAGFASLQMTQRLISMLNGSGNSDIANDQITVPLLNGKQPNLEGLRSLVPSVVVDEAAKEIGELSFLQQR